MVTTRAARHAARVVAPACNVAFQRGYAEGGDIVKDVSNQQKQFRALLDATKDLEVPVDGDSAAIKAYAEKRKAIMQASRKRNAQTAAARAARARPAWAILFTNRASRARTSSSLRQGLALRAPPAPRGRARR